MNTAGHGTSRRLHVAAAAEIHGDLTQMCIRDSVKTIILPEILTIKELAEKMKLQPSAIVKKLFLQGKIVTLNQEIDFDQAEEIAMEYEVLCEKEVKVDVIDVYKRQS